MIKRLFYSFIVFVVVLGVIAAGYSYDRIQQKNFDGKIAVLQKQISELQQKLAEATGSQQNVSITPKEVVQRQVIREKSQDELLTAAVAKVSPAVVSIVISKDVPQLEIVYQNPFGDDPFFKDFNFQIPVYRQKGVQRQQVGAGTGFLIRSDGYVLTNKHVVSDDNADYTILLSDGSQKPARVVYQDPNNDVAVIKIEGNDYPVASLGDSSTLKLGQTVAAIGNALGEYNNSVSVGIVSGLNRSIEASGVGMSEKLTGVIQTDAAINPGNSGGPLFDLNCKVVGVNVATVVGSNSISFSIPVNAVKGIIKAVGL